MGKKEFQWVDELHFDNYIKNNITDLKIYWEKNLLNVEKNIDSQQEYHLDRWVWHDGNLINNETNEKIMYLHFINWKKYIKVNELNFDKKTDFFFISYNKIHFKAHYKIQILINKIKNLLIVFWVRIFFKNKIKILNKKFKIIQSYIVTIFRAFISIRISEIIEISNFIITNKRKAFYVGCTKIKNLGDEAVLLATRKLLTKYYILDLGYQMSPLMKLFINRKLIKPDIIILGGGTLIKKDASVGFLNKINNIILLWPRIKLITFGTGTVDMALSKVTNFPINILDWKIFFEKCDDIYIRGPFTYNFIKKIGITKKINVIGDPALFFIKKKKKEIKKKKKIGINLANYAGRIYGNSEAEFKKFALEILDKLLLNKWDISFFSTCSVDEKYIKNHLFNGLDINVNYIKTDTITETLDLIETFDLVLAQRLHCLIFSDCTFTPSIPIVSELKFYDYFDSIGQKKISFKTDSINADKVYKEIVRMYGNIGKESKILYEAMNKVRYDFKETKFEDI